MKKFLILLIVIIGVTQNLAEAKQVLYEQTFQDGTVVQTCILDDGTVGYCSYKDKQNADRLLQSTNFSPSQQKPTKSQKFQQGLGTTVSGVTSVLDAVRTISGYFGI